MDTLRRLAAVAGAQGLVFALSMVLVAGLLPLLGDTAALFPHIMRVPAQPLRASASESEALKELRAGLENADVRVEHGAFVVTFKGTTADPARVRDVLQRHGFQAVRFSIGRDFGVAAITGRLLTDVRAFAIMIVSLPIVLAGVGFALRRRTAAPAWEVASRRGSAANLLIGIAGGLALAAAVPAIGWLMSAAGYPIVEQPWVERVVRADSAAPLAMLMLVAIVLAPLGEELFYRGWVFRLLSELSVPLALIVSTALFAMVHLHAPALPAYIVLGAGFALLYRRTGSILTPIVAHATNNAIAVALLLI